MKNLTLEDVSKLLGKKEFKGSKAELQLLARLTSKVVDRKGEDYVRKNRKALLSQWEYIQTTMGLPLEE